jgi:hypothetical protein
MPQSCPLYKDSRSPAGADLGDAPACHGSLVESFKQLGDATAEGGLDALARDLEGVGGGVGVELGELLAHVLGEQVRPRGSPLAPLDERSACGTATGTSARRKKKRRNFELRSESCRVKHVQAATWTSGRTVR